MQLTRIVFPLITMLWMVINDSTFVVEATTKTVTTASTKQRAHVHYLHGALHAAAHLSALYWRRGSPNETPLTHSHSLSNNDIESYLPWIPASFFPIRQDRNETEKNGFMKNTVSRHILIEEVRLEPVSWSDWLTETFAKAKQWSLGVAGCCLVMTVGALL